MTPDDAMPVLRDVAADALAIAALADLPPLKYDRIRDTEALRLGCRVSTLDAAVSRARHASNGQAEDRRPPEFTDEALALRYADLHANRLRYVAGWGKWLIWTGTHWRADQTMEAFDLSRAVCREAASQCNDHDLASNIASARTVAAVERLAKADRRLAATIDQWDADPWLLNTPGGIIDLRTSEVLPHRPDACMTKITAAPLGDQCPIWREFLDRVTAGDKELQLFIQRMVGYSLTGITRDHAMFFAYGTGGNGKGVLLNTISAILGSYAATAAMDAFTATPGDRHPTDLAMLRAARLVTSQETEEGRRWAESRIKAMTGGDPITARFMRQDFFTFTPQFKLVIAGNHKPGLRNVDEAIRRRFHLLPFTVTIPPEERDTALSEKLQAEWPGILRWAADGCLLWQEEGLAAPPSVIAATEEYLEAEDAMGQWLGDCCMMEKQFHSTSSSLFGSWSQWCARAGEYAGSQKRFSQAMQARGFESKRTPANLAGFLGIGIKPDSDPRDTDPGGL
jgi:putative DNA primase/helicase